MDRGQISNNDGSFKSVSVQQNVYVRNKITAHCVSAIKGEFAHVQTEGSTTVAGDLFVAKNTTLMGDLFVSGDTTLAQDLYVGGNTTLNGNLLVSGSTTLMGDLKVSGNTTLCSDLVVQGDTSLQADLFVSGNTTLQGDLLVMGSATLAGLYVSGNTTLHSNLLVEGDTALAGDLHVSGNSTLAGDLFVQGDTTLIGNLFVSGLATLNNLLVSGATIGELKVLGDTTLCGNLLLQGSATLEQDLFVSGQATVNQLLVPGTATLAALVVTGDSTLQGDLQVQGDTQLGQDLLVKGDTTLAQNLFVSGGSTLQGHLKVLADTSLCADVEVNGQLTTDRLKTTGNATICSDLFVQGSSHMNRIVPFSGITVSIGDVPGSVPKPVLATNILAVREIRGIGVGASVTIATSVNVLGKVTATEAVISPHFCASTTIGTGDSLLQANRIIPKTGSTLSFGSPGVTIDVKDNMEIRGTLEVGQLNPLRPATLTVVGETGDVLCVNSKLQAMQIMNKPGFTLSFCAQKLLTDKIVAKSGGSLTLINPFAGQNIEARYTGNFGNLVMGALSNVARGGRSGVFAGTGLTATGKDSVVIGGMNSRAHGESSAVLGGEDLKARGNRSVALGGINNLLTNSIEPFNFASRDSAILAGRNHTITAEMGAIIGGCDSRVDSAKGVIVGGNNVRLCGFADGSIGGGTLYSDSRNAVLVGGTSNTLFGANNSVICGGSRNTCSGMTNNMVIAGGQRNRVTGDRSCIVGGLSLVARATDSVLCGGSDNRIRNNKTRSFIGGGMSLENFANETAMCGGRLNLADEGDRGFMGGGMSNTLRGEEGAIVGGRMVVVSGSRCGALGGTSNTVAGFNSVVMGGRDSRLSMLADHSAMAGGSSNKLYLGINSFIGGGAEHSITNDQGHNAIVAGQSITVDSNRSAAVAGLNNKVSGARGFVAGGSNLKLRSGSDSALVAGADSKVNGSNSIVLAGQSHTMSASRSAVVAGQQASVAQDQSSVVGGIDNRIQRLSSADVNSSILGGSTNLILTGNEVSIIGGNRNRASGIRAFIAGSQSSTASGEGSVVVGGITCSSESRGDGIYSSSSSRVVGGVYSALIGCEDSVINTATNQHNNFLAGSNSSRIESSSSQSAVVGGLEITAANSLQCGVLGGVRTQIRGVANAVVGGIDCQVRNSSTEVCAIVAGRRNRIDDDQEESAIIVGRDCTIIDQSRTNLISGVEQGLIRLGSRRSGIISGLQQTIFAAENSVIVGGKENTIDASNNTVILGGCNQTAEDSNQVVLIAGLDNTITDSAAESTNTIIGGRRNQIDGPNSDNVIIGSRDSIIDGETSRNVVVMGNNADVNESQDVNVFGPDNTVDNSSTVFLAGQDFHVESDSSSVYMMGQNVQVRPNCQNIFSLGQDSVFTNEANTAAVLGQNVVIDGATNTIGINCRPDEQVLIDQDNFIHMSAGLDGNIQLSGLTAVRATTSQVCDDFEGGYPLRIGGFGETNANGLAIMVDNDIPSKAENNFVTFFNNEGTSLGNIHGETVAEQNLNPDYVQYITEEATLLAYNALIIAYHACTSTCVAVDPCMSSCDNILTAADTLIEVASLALVTFWLVYLRLNIGVVYNSGGCDYAEWVWKANPNEVITKCSIVGIKDGKATTNTTECTSSQFYIVSSTPLVVGNSPVMTDDTSSMVLIAMMGQARAKVRGSAKPGDYIIPSGLNDGLGRAIDPSKVTTKQLREVVGVVWNVETSGTLSIVNVAVGINQNYAAAHIDQLETRLSKVEQQVQALLGGSREVPALEAAPQSRDPEPEPEPDSTAIPTVEEMTEIVTQALDSYYSREEWEKRQDQIRDDLMVNNPEIIERLQGRYERTGKNRVYELLMNMNGVREQEFSSYMEVVQSNRQNTITQALSKFQSILQQRQ